MDVADVAKRFVALGVEQNEIESASYKSSIDALTPEGRELLYRYIDERITPGMSTSIPNADVVAEIDPETFWFNFDLQCHISIHGSLPEEMLETPYEYNGPTGLEVIEK